MPHVDAESALFESCEERFGPREDRSESLDDLEQSSEDLEKSSHDLEEASAVLEFFRRHRSGFRAFIEESLHVPSRAQSGISGLREDLEEL